MVFAYPYINPAFNSDSDGRYAILHLRTQFPACKRQKRPKFFNDIKEGNLLAKCVVLHQIHVLWTSPNPSGAMYGTVASFGGRLGDKALSKKEVLTRDCIII
ncbi:hypothetical protein AVEN_239850-1 [Araneus ventricosus]|uniref:Uncharacterized protein n=1 Tax=Araneus ventricosus TaxID=182803 RepID=A0A4Y2H317_ARAVE|nr:hypothetical protein AVEN_239850-1 [Araneus ventricosus]